MGGGGGLDGEEGEVPGINNKSPQSLGKSKARRSQLLLLRRMRPPRMLFGVRASRVGSYVQQAQTAKRFAKDKVCRGFPHPSAGRRHTIQRTHGRSLRHPRHAGSPPPSPPSAAPSPAAPGEARQGEAAGGAVTPRRGRGRGSVAERGVSAAPLRAEAPALGTGAA